MKAAVTLKLSRAASVSIIQVGTEAEVTMQMADGFKKLGCLSAAELHAHAREVEALACRLDAGRAAIRMWH